MNFATQPSLTGRPIQASRESATLRALRDSQRTESNTDVNIFKANPAETRARREPGPHPETDQGNQLGGRDKRRSRRKVGNAISDWNAASAVPKSVLDWNETVLELF